MNLKDRFKIKGRTALITGSSQGIGKAIAMGLADFGANIIVHFNRDEQKAQQTLVEIKSKGVDAFLLQGDLSDDNTPKLIYETVRSQNLSVDILILNASIQERKSWQSISSEAFDKQIKVNLKSSLQLMQLFAESMKEQQWGRIITIGSMQQTKPHPDMLVYSTSKLALVNMVKSLAKQLAPHGITVNNIAPGVFETVRNEKALADQYYRKLVLSKIPAGKFADLEDCAGISATLCSDAGQYITGQDVYVDGGMSLL